MEELSKMKKVRSPRQIRVKLANSATRSNKPMIDSIYRAKKSTYDKSLLAGKKGGSSLENYNLDLMKLS